MIYALLVFAAAVVLGALLRCLVPPPKGKDLYVAGRRVELVSLDAFVATWRAGRPRYTVCGNCDATSEGWHDVPHCGAPGNWMLDHPYDGEQVERRVVLRVVKRPDGTREVVESYESPWQFVYTPLLDGLLLRGITR